MTNIHITGDRSLSPVYPILVAVEMLRAVAAGDTVSTGDTERGVDLVVSQMGALAGVEVLVAGSVPADSQVVFVHSDPHSSSRIAPFLADDAVRIATPADLLV